MDSSRQGVDLNCATQLWSLPFDGSNAPLKKKKRERPNKAGEICDYENVTGTKPPFSLLPIGGTLSYAVLHLFHHLLAVITIPCPVPFLARKDEG